MAYARPQALLVDVLMRVLKKGLLRFRVGVDAKFDMGLERRRILRPRHEY